MSITFSKKVTITLLMIVAFLILLMTLVFALDTNGIGEVRYEWNREIYDGVNLNHTMSYNQNKDQKLYTITFDPKTTNLKPVMAFGGNAMYGSRMSDLVSLEEQKGNHVVFGINGDAYDTSNGVSNGLVINDGVLITSSNATYGWGMLEDGTVKHGSAKLNMTATIAGGKSLTLKHVNKERKLDTSGIYLLTEDFNTTTESTEAGVEVVLTVDNSKRLRIGEMLNLTVEKVEEVERNSNRNKTQIGAGKAVLSTHINGDSYNELKNLSPGTKISVMVEDGTPNDGINWDEVIVGMGIFHLLLDNGVEQPALSDPAVHPRTSMGIKADGTVILMQNDGRQIGWANGLTFREMVDYMTSLGAVTVFNFDGGGSSTISATLPGENRAQILNSPSDGNERANTNALLFVATNEPVEDKPVEKVHIYPAVVKNYAPKARILENGVLNLRVSATDRNFYSVPLTEELQYSVETTSGNSIGTIDDTGRFTAASDTGKGKIIVTHGSISAEFEIEVVNEISSIETDLTILSVAPGRTTSLDFRAFKDGVPILLSSRALDFRLDPESLGTISETGVFTATSGQGVGNLIISYKDYEFSIPVEVGRMPVDILDFESNIFENGWNKHYTNFANNGGTANITINNDERFVKHGDGSLKIEYDFATIPLTGTVAAEIGETGATTLEGQPTAIGAWIYGDGNGGWFRIQLTGGKYAGDTYINWVGWKYIETTIPTDAPFPYQVQRAVRLLGTASIANNKRGAIYIDSVRAIYDFRNDDNDAPVVDEESIFPKENATTSDLQQTISLTVRDADVLGQPKTGIDISRTQMYVNGRLVDNINQSINQDGSVDITYSPGALDRLRPGLQNIRVRIEDNFGNKAFKEWTFIVEGYAVELIENKPSDETIYAGTEFTYGISSISYQNFSSLDLEISYNHNYLQLLGDPVIDSRLIATNLEVDRQNGIIKATIIGMENNNKGTVENIIAFNFKALEVVSGTTNIKVNSAKVLEETNEADIILEGYNANLNYKYILSSNGQTKNGETILRVANESGVNFIIEGPDGIIDFNFLSDDKGEVLTDLFGKYPVGTEFSIKAIKDGYISNTINITILESLGSLIPEKINVTVGSNASASVGISFQTSHDVIQGQLQIATNNDLTDAQTLNGLSKIINTTHGGNDREYTSWGIFVEGLTANTTYYYRVGSNQGWSDIHSFKTAPDSGDIDIAFYGDIQGGYVNFPNIVARLHELYPNIALSILAGDVADNSHVYREWTDLDKYSKQYFNNGIWTATIGNHDVYDGGDAFTGFFYGPNNGTEGQDGARNYWYTIGDAIFFNFDTEAGFSSYDTGYGKQIKLLKEVMGASNHKFKIVVMHRSSYPLNYNEAGVRALAKTFEEAKIDLVLSGHDHVYNRTSMYDGIKRSILDGGVTYVVGGSASGSKYYSADTTRPWLEVYYDNKNPVFTVLKFRNDGMKLEFEAYAVENGNNVLIDSFEIDKAYQPDRVNVTLESNKVTYQGLERVIVGNDLEFRLTPNANYIINKVFVNNELLIPIGGKYLIKNVDKDLIITVSLLEDYNYDNLFNEDDALRILQHITGKRPLSNTLIDDLEIDINKVDLSYVRDLMQKIKGTNEEDISVNQTKEIVTNIISIDEININKQIHYTEFFNNRKKLLGSLK